MPTPVPLFFGRPREIASQVAACLHTRGDDPLSGWNREVIVASRGVAAAIAREVVASRGRAVARLRLQTLEDLALSILNGRGEFPHAATDAERRLAMRTAARSAKDELLSTRGMPAMLERSYRDVRDSGLTLEELRKRSRRVSLRAPIRFDVVYRVWSEYERLVASLGAVDPADILLRAAVHAATAPPQILAGFYDMTGAQLALAAALARAGRIEAACVPAGEGSSYAFAQPLVKAMRAWTLPERPGVAAPAAVAKLPIQAALPVVTEFERRDVEIREVCRAIGSLLAAGTPPAAVGIVSRAVDDYDLELFGRHSRTEGFTTSAHPEMPLRAHRFGRIVATLLRLREQDFPRTAVFELVRDGLRTRTRLHVDGADEATRRRRIAGGTAEQLRRLSVTEFAISDYVALVEEIEPLAPDGPRSGAAWADTLTALTRRFRIESELDLSACETIERIAALLRRAEAMKTTFEAGVILEAIDHATLAAPTRDELPAVWIGDVMRFRGRTFQHLFVYGMQDHAFPQRRTEDPLLPDADRRKLGVREIGDGRDEEKLLFQLLFDGATEPVRFSFSGTDGFGRILRPSQLLKNMAIELWPGRKQELLRDFGAAFRFAQETNVMPGSDSGPGALRGEPHRTLPSSTLSSRAPGEGTPGGGEPSSAASGLLVPAHGNLRALQLIARAGTDGAFDGFISDPELLARFRAALERSSPTQLEDFGGCPQKFLLKHVLRVRDIDDPEREIQINPRDKGGIDHRILETLYRSLTEADYEDAARELPNLPPGITARLRAAVEQQFARAAEAVPPSNRNVRAIEQRATERNLRDFVAADLTELLALGLRPRHFEYRFGSRPSSRGEVTADHPEPYCIRAGGVPLTVEGQIDRIDASASGAQLRVVDYKSGKAAKQSDLAKKMDRGVRLQLGLYTLAAAEFFGVQPSNVTGTVKPLAASATKKFAFNLGEKEQILRETLDLFAESIAAGRFPAFPTGDDDDIAACRYCPVSHSCRTRHDSEGRTRAARAGEARTLLEQIRERHT